MSPETPMTPERALAEWASLRAVRQPASVRVLAAIVLALFVVSALALVFTPWQQVASGKGRVIAYAPLDRQQTIEAPIDGRVTRWHVREGSVVKAGDPIVDLSDNDPALLSRLREERQALQARVAAMEARKAALAARREALAASQSGAVSAAGDRVRMAAERVRAAEEALKASEAAVKTAGLNLERQRALAARGLAATRSLELAELESARALTERARAEAALTAARSERQALAADRGRSDTDAQAAISDVEAAMAGVEAEMASIRAEIARMEVRLARQAAQAVTAPRAGVVLRLSAAQGGEVVKAGDPLAVLVPDTQDRAVELWVKGNDVPLIGVDRAVRLQFEGWPALQFSGWPSVAVGTFGGRVALVDATDDGNGLFRLLVVPDGQTPWPEARFLRQGVRANGWVLLNQVPLGFELWRQFNGFPPSAPGEEPGAGVPAKSEAPAKRLKP